MSKEYEKETRTIVHNTQRDVNFLEDELEFNKKETEYLKEVIVAEKRQDQFIGSLMIIGVLVMNFIAPIFINPATFFYTFSPKIGPVDCAVILIGAMFLWKGLK